MNRGDAYSNCMDLRNAIYRHYQFLYYNYFQTPWLKSFCFHFRINKTIPHVLFQRLTILILFDNVIDHVLYPILWIHTVAYAGSHVCLIPIGCRIYSPMKLTNNTNNAVKIISMSVRSRPFNSRWTAFFVRTLHVNTLSFPKHINLFLSLTQIEWRFFQLTDFILA